MKGSHLKSLLPSSSENKLSTSVSTYRLKEQPDGTVVQTDKLVTINIAPLNARMEVQSDVVKPVHVENIPREWDWRKTVHGISPVFHQYNCGCCWANAVVQTMNDNFLCTGQTMYPTTNDDTNDGLMMNPNMNVTNVLTSPNYVKHHNKCGGGNPYHLLTSIEKHGLSTTKMNYEWCTKKNNYCTTKCDSEKHDTKYCGEDQSKILNKIVKSLPNKTYSKTRPNSLYVSHIETPSVQVSNVSPENIIQFQTYVQDHILKYGPVVCSIPIPKNFMTGNFLVPGKNTKNLYFDRYNYEMGTFDENIIIENCSRDQHVMSIVGWGMDENVDTCMFSNDTSGSHVPVPYWIIRNSWGTEWGIEGYVRLPFYPYNKYCQIEVVEDSQKGSNVILFRPSLSKCRVEDYQDVFFQSPFVISTTQMIIIFVLVFLILCKIFL